MKIAVIGTGMVGRALAGRLAGLGHDVVIGTRDVAQTLSAAEPDSRGTPAYSVWQQEHPQVRLVPFAAAGMHGEVVVNAVAGAYSVAALQGVGEENLAGKTLIDVSVPLDMSEGMPPLIHATTSDSLGEEIQRTFPQSRVVKTLNTLFNQVMIEPSRLPGLHNLFLAGDDVAAKTTARQLLGEFGWPQDAILDLGGITAARATEMYMRLYFTLAGLLQTFEFNIAVVEP